MHSNNRSERALIGKRLRAARERAHISVAGAAESLGVQPLAVERWEKGAAMPSLIDLKGILQLYGVMACDILFEVNPFELRPMEAAELSRHARGFSPALRARVDCFLAMFAKGTEPAWRKVA
jgi:transcriptional regulator with XRE-family HTH domain